MVWLENEIKSAATLRGRPGATALYAYALLIARELGQTGVGPGFSRIARELFSSMSLDGLNG